MGSKETAGVNSPEEIQNQESIKQALGELYGQVQYVGLSPAPRAIPSSNSLVGVTSVPNNFFETPRTIAIVVETWDEFGTNKRVARHGTSVVIQHEKTKTDLIHTLMTPQTLCTFNSEVPNLHRTAPLWSKKLSL